MDMTLSPTLTYPSASRAVPTVDPKAVPEDMRRMAQDFEAFFIGRMFESMFDGIETEAPFGGGNGERMFRSLLLDEYGKSTAKAGGIGIADSIIRQLLATQETVS